MVFHHAVLTNDTHYILLYNVVYMSLQDNTNNKNILELIKHGVSLTNTALEMKD